MKFNPKKKGNSKKRYSRRYKKKIFKIKSKNKTQNEKKEDKISFCFIILNPIYNLFFGTALSYYDNNKFNSNFLSPQQTSYFNLNEEQQEQYKIHVQDYINIDPICFENAFKDVTFTNMIFPNRENYINFIFENKSKYWYDGFIKWIIKILFLIIFLIIRVLLLIEDCSCEEIPFKKDDIIYWNCQNYNKCKVNKNKITFVNIIRLIYHFKFYIIFYIYQGILLFTIEIKLIRRCQRIKTLIIGYKIIEYMLLFLIVYLEFKDNTKCYESKNNNDLYIKINEMNITLVNSILDIFINILNN